MWKPVKAERYDPPPKTQNNASVAKVPKAGGAPKKLSSSTMGMRFMRRKYESKNKEQEERKSFRQTAAARKHTTNKDSSVASQRTANKNLDRKRESEEISKNEQSASTDGYIILELASVVNMHGIGSDVVGRRSYGGFRKPVRTVYETALKKRTEEDARTKNTKSHITDEELLERYEKYVKGGSGSGAEGGGSRSGNGGRKDKRKRNG